MERGTSVQDECFQLLSAACLTMVAAVLPLVLWLHHFFFFFGDHCIIYLQRKASHYILTLI